MATIVPLFDSIGPGTAITVVGTDDTLYVQDGISLISTNEFGAYFTSSGNAIVHGVIHGQTTGIRLGLEQHGGSVFVGDTGSVSATTSFGITGRLGDANGPNVPNPARYDYTIENHGEILSFRGAAINLSGPQNSVTDGSTNDIDIRNHGVVSVHNPSNTAVVVENFAGRFSLYNGETGIMQSNLGGAIVVIGYSYTTNGGNDRDSVFRLENHGQLSASGSAISTKNTVDVVVNTGTIAGDIKLASGEDRAINTGIIDGDVSLGSGDDVFRGFGGEVLGRVLGGSGDDKYLIDQSDTTIIDSSGLDTVIARTDVLSSGEFDGIERFFLQGDGDFVVEGNDLDNTISGNAGNNVLEGSAGLDTINGGGGNDQIEGGDDEDALNGNSGDDEVLGDAGSDTLRGGSGNDILEGGDDNDTLFGQQGDDTLVGGIGRDNMTGGLGADTFVWEDIAETGSTTATADTIKGFQRGVDILDVSAINPDEAFTFIGGAAFSGAGDMEIRFTVNAAGHAIVRFDADGDGSEDAFTILRAVSTLTSDDFVL